MKKIILLFFMSFLSLCAFAQGLPLEGFDTPGVFPPTGWEVHDNGIGPAAFWVQATGTGPQPYYSEPHAAYLNRENVAAGIPEDWLVTPAFEVPDNPQLRFWSRLTLGGDDGSIYRIMITTNVTDAFDATNYTNIQEWTELEINPSQTTYTEKVVTIPDTYIGQDVKIAFVMAADNGDRWLVDDVQVVEQCLDPTNLSTPLVGLDSAELDWDNTSGATSWEVIVLPAAGIPNVDGIIYNGEPPYTATTLFDGTTPLEENTDYKFYVRALCADGGTSELVGPFLFSTVALGETCGAPIEVTTLPYSTTDNTSGYGDDYNGSPGASGCGSTSGYLNGDDVVYSYTADADGVISLDMTNTGTYAGLFVYDDCADIGVSCIAGGVGGFAATPVSIPTLSVTAGTTYYFVISTWAAPQSTAYTLTIQQVFCAPPVGLPTTGITQTTANLSWTNPSGATAWEVVVQAPGSGIPTGSGDPAATNTNYLEDGLTESTLYEYYVRAACGDGTFSAWAGPYSFGTTCGSFAVPFFEGFNSDSPTQLCWTVLNLNGDTDAWDMNYATNPFEGNQSAMMYTDFNNGNNNDWLISPTLTLTGNQRLKFHQRVQSAGEPNDFEVLVSTTGIDPADFTLTLIPLASYNNTTYVEYIVNIVDGTNTPITGDVNIAWHVPNGGLDGWRLYIDNVIVEDIPSCPDPTDLTAGNFQPNSADLSWTPGFNETAWEVVVQAPGAGEPTVAGEAVTTDPEYTAGTLTSNTAYEYYVRANCGVDDLSNWVGPFQFTTACDPFPVPFFEGFNSDSSTQNCWTVLNLNGDTDAWNMDYAINPFEGNQSAAITTDFNGGNNNDWLISPTLLLTGNQRLKFHQRVQSAGEPDAFEVLLSTTGTDAASFTVELIPLTTYSNTTYVEYIVNLLDDTDTPISGPVNIAWHVPNGGPDGWRLYIDNVIVEDIPSCPDPTALTAGNFQPNSADLSWTAGFNETAWEVVVQAPGTGEPTVAGEAVTTDPEYTAETLTSNTTYEYYVRANCGVDDLSNWVGPFQFTTACDAFDVPFFEGFNSDSETQACWTVLNENGDTDAWDMNYTPNPFEGNQSAMMYTDFNNGNNDDWLISPTINLTGNQRLRFHQRVQSAGEPNDFEVLLSTTGIDPANFTVELIPLASYNNTGYIEYEVFIDDATNTLISGPVNIAWHVPNGGLDGWRIYIDNVIIDDIPTCPQPIDIAVSEISNTTATIGWTEMGSATAWEIFVVPTGDPAPADDAVGIPADSNSFTLPEGTIDAGLIYDVYVRANCGPDDLSLWSGPETFTSALCPLEDQCGYDFVMTDTGGNTWNNNTMSVIQNGIIVATLTGPTNADGTNPVTQVVPMCPGIPFELVWNAGGFNNAQVGISIVNPFDETIFNNPPGQGSAPSTLYEGIPNCEPITCPQPTDLISEGYNFDSVQLSWTPGGTETEWEVVIQTSGGAYPGENPTSVISVEDEPVYIVTGLNPELFYEYYVRAICGPGDESFWSGPFEFSLFSPPGCAAVDVFDDELEIIAPNSEISLCPGDDACFDFSANYYQLKETDSYNVESIPYDPPYPFLGGTELNVTTDDIWSPVVDLPFEFCFFGETFDEAKVGSNGVVMFGDNMTDAGNCPWSYTQTVPNTAFPIKNAIYGVYQDINPAVAGSNVSINYQVLGNYPCRALVVNYYDVPQFSCGLDVGTQTTQIVIYEVSNIIDVYVESRTPCTGWNGGRGVIGIQNAAGTEGFTPPGRNTGSWTATEEAWRFTPDGDNLSVVFEWLVNGEFETNDTDLQVCPTEETLLTARATYTACTGEEIVKENNFTIYVGQPIDANEPQDLTACSTGEEVTFDLTESLEGIMDDPTGYNFTFYASQEAAELGGNDNLPEMYTTDTDQTVYIRITEGNIDCPIFRSFELTLTNIPPEFTVTEDITVCEGTEVTLEVFAGNFDPNSPDVEYSWALGGGDLGLTTQSITVTAPGIYEVTVNNAGCVGTAEIEVTTVPAPVVDVLADVTACDSYVLEPLNVGDYYTEANGAGTLLSAGEAITSTQEIYIYATNANCSGESSFTVTINDTPVVTTPGDQVACESYVLPALTVGNYYTGAGGTGTMLNEGEAITTDQTIFIYA
ncbi:hypothetical protein GWA97_13135, partial [Flavobacterium sp. LaA7.5]|nr:hypothetical protein [Flavobacterium salilacus subsp. altitudinum]